MPAARLQPECDFEAVTEWQGRKAEGRSTAAIAVALAIMQRAVEKHVRNILQKLRPAPADTDHRRVLAVLCFLEARSPYAARRVSSPMPLTKPSRQLGYSSCQPSSRFAFAFDAPRPSVIIVTSASPAMSRPSHSGR
jgi:Bacterial regulatory proteins, luxR family